MNNFDQDIINQARQSLRTMPESSQPEQPVDREVDELMRLKWPAPPAQEAFYGLPGEIIRIIEPHTESEPVALLISLLAAFGSVIGPIPFYRVESKKQGMRLFVALVGKSAKSRKGTSWYHIKNIFEKVDPQWAKNIQGGMSSGEGVIWTVRDPISKQVPITDKKTKVVLKYQEILEDHGVKDKRLLIVESEFASILRVMCREGNTLSQVIRNAWDGELLQTMTKNSPAKSTGAHVSIIGHITGVELASNLSTNDASNGFGNRFLWFCITRSKALPFGGTLRDSDLQPQIEKLKQAVDFSRNNTEVVWAKETRPIWAAIYENLSGGEPGLIGSLLARAEAQIVRLSSIYAILDCSREIMPRHLFAALAVWDYSEASTRYIFKDKYTENPVANKILRLLLDRPEGYSRTEISDALGRNKSSNDISEALDALHELGLAKPTEVKTSGRPQEIWCANVRNKRSKGLNSLNSFNSSSDRKSFLSQAKEAWQEQLSLPPTSNL